jgi:hypothetical protein
MNRCYSGEFTKGEVTGAAKCEVVMDYLGAGLQLPRPRKNRRKRKRDYPGFRIRMMDWYVDQILAVSECLGCGVSQFLYSALLSAIAKEAKNIGMPANELLKLSKGQRLEIRRKYRLAMRGASTLRPETN